MDRGNLDISAPVNYVRSARARRMRITVRPEPAVIVTVPLRGSLAEAQRFVASKQAWITKHLQRMAQRQQHHTQEPPPDLSKVDLAKAQNELFARLEAFSRQHELPYRRAAFRCQKSKWGSCSSQNNLSLNINMVFLPDHLQDYLLLHELAHVRHKHHGAAFWAELDRLCGGRAKALSKELKQHRMYLKG
jgi:hypothetical protein